MNTIQPMFACACPIKPSLEFRPRVPGIIAPVRLLLTAAQGLEVIGR